MFKIKSEKTGYIYPNWKNSRYRWCRVEWRKNMHGTAVRFELSFFCRKMHQKTVRFQIGVAMSSGKGDYEEIGKAIDKLSSCDGEFNPTIVGAELKRSIWTAIALIMEGDGSPGNFNAR